MVFDDLQGIIDDLRSISRETDDDDKPIADRIKGEKDYHRIAGLRYVGARLFRNLYRSLTRRGREDRDNVPFEGARWEPPTG